MKRQRVYISGGMSGYTEDDIARRFGEAESLMKSNGFKVFNPARWRWFLRFFPYRVCLSFDIFMMSFCDRVLMLEDWTCSDGARAENQFARSVGMVITYVR